MIPTYTQTLLALRQHLIGQHRFIEGDRGVDVETARLFGGSVFLIDVFLRWLERCPEARDFMAASPYGAAVPPEGRPQDGLAKLRTQAAGQMREVQGVS